MDKFLELPFWLSVTLGVLYGVIWISFLLVIYFNYRRYHRRRNRMAMHYSDSYSAGDTGAFNNVDGESESVYDDDDD